METGPQIQCFGAFELDRANRQLRHDGIPVELGNRYFDALTLLLDRQGELVTKDTFMREVWGGIPVTDEALTQCIRTLRRALGDSSANPRFIQTVPKHGYRFLPVAPNSADARSALSAARVAGACTLGGMAAGFVAGGIYGAVGSDGSGDRVLILAAIVGALGMLAGAGLGAGLAAVLAWRGKADPWLIAGGGAGGLAVGLLGSMLGREGIALLSGRAVGTVTGPMEGLVLGIATGIVALMAFGKRPMLLVAALSVVLGAFAGWLIDVAGGTLLGGSLWSVEQGLQESRLAIERVGMVFGADGFTLGVQRWTSVVEGAVLLLFLTNALLLGSKLR